MKTLLTILFTSLFGLSAIAQEYKGATSSRSIEEKLNEEYCSGLFQSTHGQILDISSNPGSQAYLNILDWLQGRVAGLQVYKTRSGISIPVIRGGVPGIFIDEVQVPVNMLNNISIYDIAIIKVIKTPFYGGFNSGNGAIAIYTLGNEEDEEADSDSK
jgi:hypothetical protein